MASHLSLAQFDSAPILPPGVQPVSLCGTFHQGFISGDICRGPLTKAGRYQVVIVAQNYHDSTCPFWVCILAFLTQSYIPDGHQPAAGWADPAAVPSCAWCLSLTAPLLGHRAFPAEFVWLHSVVWLSSSIAELSQFHLGLVF